MTIRLIFFLIRKQFDGDDEQNKNLDSFDKYHYEWGKIGIEASAVNSMKI